jgi:hypothetical protein
MKLLARAAWRGQWWTVAAAVACASATAGCSSAGSSTEPPITDAASSSQEAAASDANAGMPGHDATIDDAAPARDGGTTQEDAGSDAGCTTGSMGEALDLRCTGLYSDWASKTIASDVHAYDPGLHLWSDGADKNRWIQLPPGTQIDSSDMDEWNFPTGTKVWKEFLLNGQPIETRLLWKYTDAAWYATVYRWAADQASAPELTAGEQNVDDAGYEIPAAQACPDCHKGRIDYVLGFEAVALSSPDASGLTMSALLAANLLTTPPTQPLVIPGDATTSAALGYMHMNCGVSCHNRDTGGATQTAFYARLDVSQLVDGGVRATDLWMSGVNQMSHFLLPGAAHSVVFAPNDVDASVAYYRMDHRDFPILQDGGGIQMPPIITHKLDDAGLAIVSAWINSGCQ